MSQIMTLLKELPPALQRQVEDFIRFLLATRESRPVKKPKFAWASALKNIGRQTSSVDLQHRLADMRRGKV